MSYFRNRFSLLYRWAAVWAVFAILVPVAVSAGHQPGAVQSLIHICGVESHGNEPGKAPAHPLPSCPICQSLHLVGGGFVPPEMPVVARVLFVASVAPQTASYFIGGFILSPQAQPRAPPRFV